MTDSLLTACKKVAELARIPWAKAQPIYRALQATEHGGQPLLPTSRGRSVCPVEPVYVFRFLVGIATSDHRDNAPQNVIRYCFMRHIDKHTTLEEFASHFLLDGWDESWDDIGDELEANINRIFDEVENKLFIERNTGRMLGLTIDTDDEDCNVRVTMVGRSDEVFREESTRDVVYISTITKTIKIAGILFARIKRSISW